MIKKKDLKDMIKWLALLCTWTLVFSAANAVIVQGHRGFRGLYPENTLPGFAAAIEAQANVLEMDLHVSQDGQVIIYHDFFLSDGCLTVNKPICSLTLQEIKKIDCGSKENADFPSQKKIPHLQIPTLDEVFTLLETLPHPNAKEVRLNLEIKRDPRHPEFTEDVEVLARTIVHKVQERGFTDRVYYSSFDPNVLTAVRKLDQNATLGLIFEEQGLAFLEKITFKNPIELMLKVAKSFSATILSPHYTVLTDAAMVQGWQNRGFQVIPWTVNAPSDWQKCLDMGVDGMITDYPSELLKALKN